MADTYKYVQGDTGPQIQVTITNADGAATNLSGSGTTITLHFRAAGTTTVLFSRALTISDASGGKAVLQFSTGDLDVDAGNYEGELETVIGSLRETRYELLKFKIREDFA